MNREAVLRVAELLDRKSAEFHAIQYGSHSRQKVAQATGKMLAECAAELRSAVAAAPEPVAWRDVLKQCEWPPGARFSVNDEPGEHDPCWLVMPDGASLALNHHATNGVDQARAIFIASACNDRIALTRLVSR